MKNSIDFKLNGKRDITRYRVNSGEDKEMRIILKDTNKITLLPIVSGENNNFECNGKVKTFNTETLVKCI